MKFMNSGYMRTCKVCGKDTKLLYENDLMSPRHIPLCRPHYNMVLSGKWDILNKEEP